MAQLDIQTPSRAEHGLGGRFPFFEILSGHPKTSVQEDSNGNADKFVSEEDAPVKKNSKGRPARPQMREPEEGLP